MITKARLLKEVRESIKKWNPPGGDFEMLILEEQIRKRDGRWWVPIYPSREPKRQYHLIDSLGELETELQFDKQLDVEIVPVFRDVAEVKVSPVKKRAPKSARAASV